MTPAKGATEAEEFTFAANTGSFCRRVLDRHDLSTCYGAVGLHVMTAVSKMTKRAQERVGSAMTGKTFNSCAAPGPGSQRCTNSAQAALPIRSSAP
ncbi:hypothetical protein [Streptomyces sp. NPDC001139]